MVYLLRDKLTLLAFRKKNLLISLTLGLLFLQLIIAIIQVSRGSSIGIVWLGESIVSAGNVHSSTLDLNGQLFLRGYGTFSHPNLLAGYSVFVFTLFLSLYKPLKVIKKRVLIFSSVTSFLVLFATMSHGGLLAYGSILMTYLLYLLYLKLFKGKRNFYDYKNIGAFLILADRSVNERILLIKSSWEYFVDNIFTGVGSGNFLKNFYNYSPVGEEGISLMQPVHNIYILMMVEYGVFGGLLLNIFLLMFFIYRFLISRYKIIVFLFLIYLLVLGSVDHYFVTLPQGLFLLLSSLLFLVLVG